MLTLGFWTSRRLPTRAPHTRHFLRFSVNQALVSFRRSGSRKEQTRQRNAALAGVGNMKIPNNSSLVHVLAVVELAGDVGELRDLGLEALLDGLHDVGLVVLAGLALELLLVG